MSTSSPLTLTLLRPSLVTMRTHMLASSCVITLRSTLIKSLRSSKRKAQASIHLMLKGIRLAGWARFQRRARDSMGKITSTITKATSRSTRDILRDVIVGFSDALMCFGLGVVEILHRNGVWDTTSDFWRQLDVETSAWSKIYLLIYLIKIIKSPLGYRFPARVVTFRHRYAHDSMRSKVHHPVVLVAQKSTKLHSDVTCPNHHCNSRDSHSSKYPQFSGLTGPPTSQR